MVTPRDLPGLEEDLEYLFEQLEEWIKGKKERYRVIARFGIVHGGLYITGLKSKAMKIDTGSLSEKE